MNVQSLMCENAFLIRLYIEKTKSMLSSHFINQIKTDILSLRMLPFYSYYSCLFREINL